MNVLHLIMKKKSTSKFVVQKGGQANADERTGEGGVIQMLTIAGGGGVQETLNLADVICEQPLGAKKH